MAILVGHIPAHPDKGAGYVLVSNGRADGFEVGLLIKEDVDGSPRRRGHEPETRCLRANLPQQKALLPLFAIVEAPDRARIRDQLTIGLPHLVPVDMTE